jgi:hypothetical protein
LANYEPKRIDMVGLRFSRLTVVGFAFTRNKQAHWHCRCDCGNETIVARGNLMNRSVVSCGCKQREDRIKHGHANLTHGHAKPNAVTREYHSWMSMKQRCYDPKHTYFKDYGGRGIKVCARWRTSFENFLADMGPRPIGKTLDRKNSDGSYTPRNCRWATPLVQRHNRR